MGLGMALFLFVLALNLYLYRKWPALRPARRMERISRWADRHPYGMPAVWAAVYAAFLWWIVRIVTDAMR